MDDSEDKEVLAMQRLNLIMADLDDDQRGRVLAWGAARYGLKSSTALTPAQDYENTTIEDMQKKDATFVDFFDRVSPDNQKEMVLAAAYWLQFCEENESFASQAANEMLKNLGHGISNIAMVLGRMNDEKPSLIRQVQKSGTTKQARKLYRVTEAGRKRVQTLMNKPTNEDVE